MGAEQLHSLEAGDREHLPEPVFVLAQARRVATALQLDIEPQLQTLRRSGELAAYLGPRAEGASAATGSPTRGRSVGLHWRRLTPGLIAAIASSWRALKVTGTRSRRGTK